jgi:aryl-alcohol dehydrogenase-like predicted oxidoreductase
MPESKGIPMRDFSRSGVKVSAIARGGHHLGDPEDTRVAHQLVQEAIDGGITLFDNCWEYHQGKSEEWLGSALKGKRNRAFLMTKGLHAWPR